MDERNKGLLKNTSILMIGNFSTKFLSFILVPVYTLYFLPSEYGEVDFYLTLLSMLYILVSLQSIESAFRFIQDGNEKENFTNTITNSTITALFGIVIFSIIMVVYELITSFKYSYLFIFFVATSILANLFMHTLRGMNKTMSYVVIGIITTVVSFACNIMFVVGLGLGAQALLITPIIVNIVMIIIILYKEKIYHYFKISAISKNVLKEHLKFSIPLIPNAISIWLLSSIGRFVLLFFYGAHAVGLLAFSLKFPLLLGTFSGIFFMAWQVSAISQYMAKDKNLFASNVFNQFALLLLSSLLLFLPSIKILIFTIMGEAYKGTWIYIPIFLLGIIFKSFSQFYSVGFFGAKKTNVIFQSSMIAAILFFILSMILAKPLYILGIGIAYAISELINWIYISWKVAPYMKIKINFSVQTPILLILLLFIIVYYIISWKYQFVMLIIGLIFVLIFNKQIIKKIYNTILNRF